MHRKTLHLSLQVGFPSSQDIHNYPQFQLHITFNHHVWVRFQQPPQLADAIEQGLILHFEIIFSPDFLTDIILSDENSDVFAKNREHIVFAIPQTDRFISVIQLLLGWIETKVTEHKLLLRYDQVKHFTSKPSRLPSILMSSMTRSGMLRSNSFSASVPDVKCKTLILKFFRV